MEVSLVWLSRDQSLPVNLESNMMNVMFALVWEISCSHCHQGNNPPSIAFPQYPKVSEDKP